MSRSSTLPRRLAQLVGLVCLLGLAACQSSPDKRILQYLNTEGFGKRYSGNVEDENYVTIGDQISIYDAYHAELRVTDSVDIDGTMILPELGAVAVAGFTRTELEAFLTEKFSPYYEQLDISVKINAQGKQYFIFGEVAQEGAQNFPGDLTVFEAVMASGPTDDSANLGRVRLIRADPRDPLVIIVNVAEMLRTGDSTYNVLVQENDILFVPPTFMARLGIFIRGLINPITQVLRDISRALNPNQFGFGGRGRGRGGAGGFNTFF